MGRFTIRLEGRIEVVSGCERQAVPSSVQPLTVALVTSGISGIDRGQLVDLLWPDQPERRCRRRLNTALWRLRELVGPDADGITSSSSWLGLDPARVHVDVQDLLSVSATRPARRRTLPIETMLRAAETNVDRFASGCAHPYVAQVRDDLRAAHTEVCAEIASRALADGDDETCVFWARRVLAEDPYREELHQVAIRALHRLGRAADAERQFTECRDLLRRDLGVEPQPATLAAASGHVRPSPVRLDHQNELSDLRGALERAIRSCEQAAQAGAEALAAVDELGRRDAAVTARDRSETVAR